MPEGDHEMTLFERLAAFAQAFAAGEDPDPFAYTEGLTEVEQRALLGFIDAYLREAPRLAPELVAESLRDRITERAWRAVAGRSGLWPLLLPALRERARKLRREVVAELAARLGASSREAKIADYYHRMEQGSLPAAGVSDTVLEALAKVLGTTLEELRQAGRALPALGPEPRTSSVFARTAEQPSEPSEESRSPSANSWDEWDEIDRLFLGGPPPQ
ncbi:helix-turn-helix domain-containing protein [Thermoleophilum album]|uniref:Helix-turn-helix domain-containing protein n=1 Tax=Thermoleophilum album TaxID=29539 RepID=A0A1H6FKJ6_THEAL|nr:helix-turn-helix transcriptional regulator [Thermoleophilum album]SEH10355.1 Helix-turn-helix domain-containing protein [Thermoleophilum album]